MVPYVVGKFLGCDLVMDDDEVLKQAHQANEEEDIEKGDVMMINDAPVTMENEVNTDPQEMQILVSNKFGPLITIEEGEYLPDAVLSPLIQAETPGKKRKNKPPISHSDFSLSVVLDISAADAALTPQAAQNKNNVVDNGRGTNEDDTVIGKSNMPCTPGDAIEGLSNAVIRKKSLRQRAKSAKPIIS